MDRQAAARETVADSPEALATAAAFRVAVPIAATFLAVAPTAPAATIFPEAATPVAAMRLGAAAITTARVPVQQAAAAPRASVDAVVVHGPVAEGDADEHLR